MTKTQRKQSLFIPGPQGSLEALLEYPAVDSHDSVAIVCHPHPLYQGTMHNKVVHTLARAAQDNGMPAVRFNFRGTGASAGSYGGGEGEMEDLRAVVEWVRANLQRERLCLLGFSFGAVVAARTARRVAASRLVTVAPAVTVLGEHLAEIPDMPWLVVQGGQDDVVAPQAVRAWIATLQPEPEFRLLPEAGHFFHGQLAPLRTAVSDWLR